MHLSSFFRIAAVVGVMLAGFFPAVFAQTPERLITPAQMDSLDAVRLAYIEKYGALAMREQARSGIPASIKLAQGILETSAGASQLAQQANNHFGIKCGPHWNGGVLYKHDDEFQRNGQPLLSCFRVFNSVDEGYAAHTDFLVDPEKYNRYGLLFNLAPTDYAGWARGLQQAGYTNAGHYAARLIEYIERYRLNELDLAAAARPATPGQRRFSLDGTSFTITRNGETLRDLAEAYGLDLAVLHGWNEAIADVDYELPRGARVLLAPKMAQWSGEKTHHWVQGAQTLAEIAQVYGLRLDELRRRNNLRAGQEPASGARLRLKGPREADEKPVAVRSRSDAPLIVEMIPPDAPARQLPPMNPANTRRLRTTLQSVTTAVDARPQTQSFVLIASSTADSTGLAGANADQNLHVVVRGDTLFNIARRYGLSAKQLKQLNEMKGDDLREGQVLRVK